MRCGFFGIFACDGHVQCSREMYGEQNLLMMKILAAIILIEHCVFVCVDEIRMKFEVIVNVFFSFIVQNQRAIEL